MTSIIPKAFAFRLPPARSGNLTSPRQFRRCRPKVTLWWAVPLLSVLILQGVTFHRYVTLDAPSSSSSWSSLWAPSYGHLLAERLRSFSDDYRTSTSNRTKGYPPGDGTFNGYPIYKLTSTLASNAGNVTTSPSSLLPLYSQLHCVGETWHPPFYWKRKRTFQDISWQYRSCHFEFFCYDVEEKDFVLYLDPKQRPENHLSHGPPPASFDDTESGLWDVSQTYYHNMTTTFGATVGNRNASTHHPYGLSLGSINGKWGLMGIPRLRWFPQVRYGPVPMQTKDGNGGDKDNDDNPYQVYTLPSSVVMVPFHSLSASNPGHLVWDDFLPIYTLLHIFGLDHGATRTDHHKNRTTAAAVATASTSTTTTSKTESSTTSLATPAAAAATADLLLFRYVLPPDEDKGDPRGLWAGCDWLHEQTYECQKRLHKFAPLMVRHPPAWKITTQKDPQLEIQSTTTDNDKDKDSTGNGNNQKKKPLICARNGVAGLGALNDHGTEKGHGWEERDYRVVHNHGRGGQLWRFRNYMMSNLGIIAPHDPISSEMPLLVYVSEHSSDKAHRSFNFDNQIRALQDGLKSRGDALGLPEVIIEAHQFKRFSVRQQVDMVSKAAVYVTACGGGAVTATFLPRDASLLVYFSPLGGVENNKVSNKPARLDWDYLNNLGYLRVHWIPQTTRSQPQDVTAFTDLVLHELQIVHQKRIQQQQERVQQQHQQQQ